MSESTIHIDRSCIFRETFNNVFDIHNNMSGRGLINNVIISNGVGKFNGNSSYITHQLKIKTKASSYRFLINKLTLRGSGTEYLIDTRLNNTTVNRYIAHSSISNTLTTYFGSPKFYINGVPFTNSSGNFLSYVQNNNDFELVVTFNDSSILNKITEGSSVSLINSTTIVNYKLIEIYNRELTASEVKLLYQKILYSKINIPNENLLLDFDATDGLLLDKSGKNKLIINNVESKKIGSIYAAYFPSITMNSSYILTKEKISRPIKTILFWAKVDKYNVDNYFGVVSGAVTLRYYVTTTKSIEALGGTGYVNNTGNNVITNPSEFNLYVINFFTTPIIGNSIQIGLMFKGYLAKFRVYDIYLSNEQIQQIYNSEKQQFGL